jgi:predicted transcriptional regulator YdeE
MSTADVPAQTYAVFRLALTAGDLHAQMHPAAIEIWARGLKDAGITPAMGPNFELYPADFRGARDGGWVEYWIPVSA